MYCTFLRIIQVSCSSNKCPSVVMDLLILTENNETERDKWFAVIEELLKAIKSKEMVTVRIFINNSILYITMIVPTKLPTCMLIRMYMCKIYNICIIMYFCVESSALASHGVAHRDV